MLGVFTDASVPEKLASFARLLNLCGEDSCNVVSQCNRHCEHPWLPWWAAKQALLIDKLKNIYPVAVPPSHSSTGPRGTSSSPPPHSGASGHCKPNHGRHPLRDPPQTLGVYISFLGKNGQWWRKGENVTTITDIHHSGEHGQRDKIKDHYYSSNIN